MAEDARNWETRYREEVVGRGVLAIQDCLTRRQKTLQMQEKSAVSPQVLENVLEGVLPGATV